MRLSHTIAGIFAGVTASVLATIPAYAAANTVTVQPGNSMWTIAKSHGVSVQALESANPSVNPGNLLVGTTLNLPGNNTVTVQAGNTMWSVAKSQGITVQALENANPSVNPDTMPVGTTLRLPTATTPSSVPTSAGHSSYDTSGNLYWMEHIINAEAGGQSLQTQIAVGDVILHRMQTGTYGGNSVYDVVFQKTAGIYQFTSVENGYIYNTPNASSIQAAKDVLQSGTEEVPGALVFYNPAQTPAHSWVWSQPTIKRIGSLIFAK